MIRRIQIVEPDEAEKDFWKGFPLIRKRRERRLNLQRLRETFRSFVAAGASGAAAGDPFFASVRWLMDWEDSATLGNNDNLGNDEITVTYLNATLTSTAPLSGAHSIISGSTSTAIAFANWFPGGSDTDDWTVEWSVMWNGNDFPNPAGTGAWDLVTWHNATTNKRSFVFQLKGAGDGTHDFRLVLDDDGTSGAEYDDTVSAGGALSSDNTTVYHFALERYGENVYLYMASELRDASDHDVTYSHVGTFNIGSFDLFDANENFRIGVREDLNGNGTPSGRTDNVRMTDLSRRSGSTDDFTQRIPHPRST